MIIRSPLPDVSIPDMALVQFVLEHARDFAHKPALIDASSGRTIEYGELEHQVQRVAAALAARGMNKGDVLALWSPNRPEYAVAFLAVALIGGVTTTLNPLYTVEEGANQMRDAGARLLITAPGLMEKASAAAALAGVEEIVAFGEAPGATPFDRLIEHIGDVPRVKIDAREDVVALPYSSGTTGLPKGVMLTHRNLVANIAQVQGCGVMTSDDTLVCVLPMFHIYGLSVILASGLREGCTIVTLPRFDLEVLLGSMQDKRVTFAHLVPPIVLALSKHPAVERYDLSSLRVIFSGAAPLGEELTRVCAARLRCDVKQGYGMTETSPVTHMSLCDAAHSKPGSVGCCVASTECRIVDPATGAELGVGQRGEICVRGPQVMKGYLNRPEATANLFDGDGWLHTGDIGYADADGCFFVVDRVKELIKYKGFQIAPAELEAVLLTHPAVVDAAVIPIADEEAGEVPKAFVVLRSAAGADEIKAFVAARVAPHKKLRKVEITDQIPKSPSGKILRRLLVERERQQRR